MVCNGPGQNWLYPYFGNSPSLPTQKFHFVVAKNHITCKSNPGPNLPHPFNFPLYKFHSVENVNEFLSGASLGIIFWKKLDKPSFFRSVKYGFAAKKIKKIVTFAKSKNTAISFAFFFPPLLPSIFWCKVTASFISHHEKKDLVLTDNTVVKNCPNCK